MKGSGKTRIDTFLVNPTAAHANAGIEYDYASGRTFDHVPINMYINMKRFEDTISVAIQPAPIQVASLSGLKQVERNRCLRRREEKYDEVWKKHSQPFREAIEERDIEKAHAIWCLAAETYLWELQGNGKSLPMSKPRRGKVLPRCVQKVAGKVCDHSRMERNWFTQGVDRVIGLAHDLKQRLRRLLQTKQDGDLTTEEWALREKQQLVIKVSETEGEVEGTEEANVYDHKTAGKTTWRLAKEVTKLGKEFDNLMKETRWSDLGVCKRFYGDK